MREVREGIAFTLSLPPLSAPTIPHMLPDHPGPRTIALADNAYDADRIRAPIDQLRRTYQPEPIGNGKPCFNKRLYREHDLIERFF
jgi:transposase